MQETLETQVQTPGGEAPLEEEIAVHSSVLACRIHRQGSLVGYSPWGHRESDTAERLTVVSRQNQYDFER